MNFNKEDVSSFVKKNEMPYRGTWVVSMTILVWMLDLMTVIGNMNNMLNILMSIIFTLLNIFVTISTMQYIKHKTIQRQNLNLGAFTASLSIFLLLLSVSSVTILQSNNWTIVYYLLIIIVSSFIYILIKKNRIAGQSKKQGKSFKQNATIGSLGAIVLYFILRTVASSLEGNDAVMFYWIIFLSGAILSICMSSNYFLKAYLIKKYDLDEPVKIVEE